MGWKNKSKTALKLDLETTGGNGGFTGTENGRLALGCRSHGVTGVGERMFSESWKFVAL